MRAVARPVVVEARNWAFSPGLKPGHWKTKRSRWFENPLPGLKSGAGTARLESGSTQQRVFPQAVKACPDAKHEFFRSL